MKISLKQISFRCASVTCKYEDKDVKEKISTYTLFYFTVLTDFQRWIPSTWW